MKVQLLEGEHLVEANLGSLNVFLVLAEVAPKLGFLNQSLPDILKKRLIARSSRALGLNETEDRPLDLTTLGSCAGASSLG